MKKIHVRFNTNYPLKSRYEWRLLIDGEEELVNSVMIETPCYTTESFIEGHGMKCHITTEANSVEIEIIENKKYALIL